MCLLSFLRLFCEKGRGRGGEEEGEGDCVSVFLVEKEGTVAQKMCYDYKG